MLMVNRAIVRLSICLAQVQKEICEETIAEIKNYQFALCKLVVK